MKENSEFKPVKLRLKINFVSFPARTEGLGKYEQINSRLNMLPKNYSLKIIYKCVSVCVCVCVCGLVSLFNGISIFVGYLMPKLFSSKNSSGTI